MRCDSSSLVVIALALEPLLVTSFHFCPAPLSSPRSLRKSPFLVGQSPFIGPVFLSTEDDNTKETAAEEGDAQEESKTVDFPSMFGGEGEGEGRSEESPGQWRDPAMSANTNPFNLSWWGWIIVLFPIMLLANDFFHFLPEGGIASLFSQDN